MPGYQNVELFFKIQSVLLKNIYKKNKKKHDLVLENNEMRGLNVPTGRVCLLL